jgi:processive 1,2-diacylglycerol beta-glucosyltransferase
VIAGSSDRETSLHLIVLYNNETGQLLGTLTEEELQQLVDALEEESETDQDYYIDAVTIDLIADKHGSDHLVQLLRSGLGAAEGVEIRWQRR